MQHVFHPDNTHHTWPLESPTQSRRGEENLDACLDGVCGASYMSGCQTRQPLERVLHQLNDIKRYSPPGQPHRQKQLSTLTDDKVQNGEDNNWQKLLSSFYFLNQVSPTGRYGDKFICPPNSTIKSCRWELFLSLFTEKLLNWWPSFL